MVQPVVIKVMFFVKMLTIPITAAVSDVCWDIGSTHTPILPVKDAMNGSLAVTDSANRLGAIK